MRWAWTALVAAACGAPGDPVEITVDAHSTAEWVHVDLDPGAEHDAAGAWDLGLQQVDAKVNGGVSGTAGVEVALVASPFEAVTEAPTGSWRTDQDDDGDGVTEYALDPWTTDAAGAVQPTDAVFAVRSSDARVYAVAFRSWYGEGGEDAIVTLEWKELRESP